MWLELGARPGPLRAGLRAPLSSDALSQAPSPQCPPTGGPYPRPQLIDLIRWLVLRSWEPLEAVLSASSLPSKSGGKIQALRRPLGKALAQAGGMIIHLLTSRFRGSLGLRRDRKEVGGGNENQQRVC